MRPCVRDQLHRYRHDGAGAASGVDIPAPALDSQSLVGVVELEEPVVAATVFDSELVDPSFEGEVLHLWTRLRCPRGLADLECGRDCQRDLEAFVSVLQGIEELFTRRASGDVAPLRFGGRSVEVVWVDHNGLL